jgi:hypothetical protein
MNRSHLPLAHLFLFWSSFVLVLAPRFMVPIRACERRQAFHEPKRVPGFSH